MPLMLLDPFEFGFIYRRRAFDAYKFETGIHADIVSYDDDDNYTEGHFTPRATTPQQLKSGTEYYISLHAELAITGHE